MKKILFAGILSLALFATTASAHVTVRPDKVGVGSFNTFNVSVPSEKEVATTSVRLQLPMTLTNVTPTVKPGWRIEVKTHQMNGEEHPYEIVWSGGSIPAHMRDDFTFSARVPSDPGALNWKAYQTYADGSVVSWEMDPKAEPFKNPDGSPDFSKAGPYSTTQVVNDLTATPAVNQSSSGAESKTPLYASGVAILISLISLVLAAGRRPGTPAA